MVPRYAEHMNALNDIHGLIEAACNKIQLLETLAPDWENPETSNSDLDTRSEDGLNELATSLFDEASLQQFVIERRGQYFCSECSFQTNSYKMFCKHCAKLHPTVDSGVKNGQVPQVYRCIKCNYLALSFRGFKTHCIGKHRCFPHVVLQSVPLNCPKAEFYFQKFSETAESNQKKQALKLLNYFSAHKPHNFVAEKTEIIEENNESKEEVRCSICDYSTSLVYFLEKHYQTQHRRKGPSRNQTDSLFHCKDCTFTSISYKELHLHIFKIHTKNSTYFNFSQSTQCNNANNVTDYVIPESPAPSLGCYDNDTACILHCHLCSFSTSSISVMLNHWRSFHNRDYPLFVNQYINSNFSKNLIIVDIPVSMLDRSWTGGWVNEDLTGLLHKPLYHCSECSFSTVSLSTLNHHYSSAHPTVTYCSSKLDVSDAQPVDHVSNNGLFTHSTMRQCCYCDEFVTYFTKCMSEHHRTSHKIMKNDDNEDAGSRAVHRCVECGYCAEQEQMAQHYVSNHAINAITFTVESSADEFEAFCSFCSFSSTSLQDLSQHLLEHRTEHLTNYKHRHVTGYCCSICRRVFRQKHTLQYHYSRLHVDWNENCFEFKDFPPRFFTKNSALTSVAYKHETRSSSAGPLVATDQTSLDANMRQSPPSSQDNATDDARPTSSTIKSGYLCYLCNFSARNAKIVQDHLKDKHDVSMSISSVIRDTCRDAKRVVVSTCSHQFYALSKTDTYQKHVEALHNEKEPFACPHCFRKYICRVVLRMHVSKKHKHASTDDVSKKHRHASTDDVSNKHRLASTDDVSNKHRLASTDDVSKKHRLASTDDVKPKSSPRVLITNCSYRNSMRPVLYESHIAQKHNKESPYHCPRCVRVYVCRSMFLGHIRKKHRLQLTDQRVSRCRRPIPSYLRPATAVSLSSKPSATEIEANQSKDYQQPKSIQTDDGQWRCLYCKVLFQSYAHLRRHCMRKHPSSRMLRCRWCDFICKTNVQLTNHSRIHAKFVAARMKVLRQICSQNREDARKNKNSEAPKVNDDVMEVNSPGKKPPSPNINETSPEAVTARKTTKKVYFCRKTIPKPLSDSSKRVNRHYLVTEQGTYRCRLCHFICAEKSRVLWHLKSSHANRKMFKCKLCSFQHEMFDQIHAHLSKHHKMERNHEMGIEVTYSFGEAPKPLVAVPVKDEDSDSDCDFPMDQDVEPGSLGSRPVESSDGLNFKCSYCDASMTSSYEAECHMVRHERCMVNSMEIDEGSMMFANFTSFLLPL